MSQIILVINAGSSSIKFRVFEAQGDQALGLMLRGQVEGLYTQARFAAFDAQGEQVASHSWNEAQPPGHDGAVAFLGEFLQARGAAHRLLAVGHRVVHGGLHYAAPVRIDAAVLQALTALSPLAPLHQPHNLQTIELIARRRPELPQVACFDTAFHRTQDELAQAFALPEAITRRGVRRYGFHGLSYEYIAGVLPQFDERAAAGRTIVAHLGNGASLCAMRGGASVASTMGFTAVEGLPMGTRCGSLDPGVVLYLMQELQMAPHEVEDLLYKQSGLLGVSGLSSDMRVLLASSDARARLAVDLYVYRIGREIGSMAAALQGLDALVFTAGIGENAAAVRERVCRDAAWLGIELDREANARHGPRISAPGSRVSAWVIPTNEERMIARQTLALAAGGASH